MIEDIEMVASALISGGYRPQDEDTIEQEFDIHGEDLYALIAEIYRQCIKDPPY